MKKTGRSITFIVAAVMALTCFVPMEGVAFATEGSQKTAATQNRTQNTTATQTKATAQTKTTTQTKATTKGAVAEDPYANYTGWIKKGKKYYYYKKGKPVKGIKKIKKTWYEFNKKSGVYKRTIGDNMDKKAQKYKSKRKYLILVSYDRHRVRIYKGKKNNWNRIKNFKCTLGKRSTPTPKGTYTIGNKGKYFNTGYSARCWYWTGFIGNIYLFHSVLYNRNSRPNHIIDGRLGVNASHGCIRLSLKNAKWIYKHVPRRTKVVIY